MISTEQIQINLAKLCELCQWFNPEVPPEHVEMVKRVFGDKRLNDSDVESIWVKIINEFRKKWMPSEPYYTSEVRAYINNKLSSQPRTFAYDPLTEEERAEAAEAATAVKNKYFSEVNEIYGGENAALQSQREQQERENAVRMHRQSHIKKVKEGMVELTTYEAIHYSVINNSGPVWMKKVDAIAQGLSEENGDFKCHRARFVEEVSAFDRIAKDPLVESFR